jgi:hypothetical protein
MARHLKIVRADRVISDPSAEDGLFPATRARDHPLRMMTMLSGFFDLRPPLSR